MPAAAHSQSHGVSLIFSWFQMLNPGNRSEQLRFKQLVATYGANLNNPFIIPKQANIFRRRKE